jgi:hypothetical protein
MLDEATGTRVNAQGNTLADLAPSTGSVTNDTINKMEGAAAAVIDADNDLLVSGAGAIINLSNTATWGCWIRPTRGGVTGRSLILFDGAGIGFSIDRNPTDAYQLYIDTTVSTGSNFASPVVLQNVWHHIVGRFDTAAITVFLDGASVATGSKTGLLGPMAAATTIQLGNAAAAPAMWSQIDECFISGTAFSNAAICRICSCGIRGEQCTCNGSTFVSKGRNATNCGNCTLPADCGVAVPTAEKKTRH